MIGHLAEFKGADRGTLPVWGNDGLAILEVTKVLIMVKPVAPASLGEASATLGVNFMTGTEDAASYSRTGPQNLPD